MVSKSELFAARRDEIERASNISPEIKDQLVREWKVKIDACLGAYLPGEVIKIRFTSEQLPDTVWLSIFFTYRANGWDISINHAEGGSLLRWIEIR